MLRVSPSRSQTVDTKRSASDAQLSVAPIDLLTIADAAFRSDVFTAVFVHFTAKELISVLPLQCVSRNCRTAIAVVVVRADSLAPANSVATTGKDKWQGPAELTLNQNGDTISGTLVFTDPQVGRVQVPISSGIVSKDAVTFSGQSQFPLGGSIEVTFHGTVNGTSLSGTTEGGYSEQSQIAAHSP